MKISLIFFTLMFSTSMALMTQKLITKGSVLMISAILSTTLTAITTNSWYAFILFLIFITGLLVIFGYFLAMSSNVHQSTKKCFKSYILILTLMISVWNPKTIMMPLFKMSFEKDVLSLITQFNMPIYWFMAMILLVTLLMVVSLTFKSPSPMRHFLNCVGNTQGCKPWSGLF